MSILEHQVLIIGGQPKAGTSSLNHWLSQHPEIAAPRVKEPRFFLDAEYPVPSGVRFTDSNIEHYLSFFDGTGCRKTLLDVSPDYLYCETPLRLLEFLPNARILFVIRDPVERAVSWYKYAAQMGYLSKDYSFERYVQDQLAEEVVPTTPIQMRALEQNRIEKYLPPFQKIFGDRCMVMKFADMKSDPKNFVQRICSFAGLDPTFFDTFDFTPQNVSTGERASRSSRIYYRTRAAFNYFLKPSPKTIALVRPFGLGLKALLIHSRELEKIEITASIKASIEAHAQT